MVGREAFIFYFEAEVLMLKYNKSYSYLLSFLASKCSDILYHIKTSYWNAENKYFRTTNSDVYQVLPSQNSIETFFLKNYEKKKEIESGAFSMVGWGR